MAATITQNYNIYRESFINITGLLTASVSPSFRSRSLVAGSFVVSGTWATSVAVTVQLQGSNDGVSFVNIGTALTASSGTVPQAGSISPDGFFFSFYQFVATGGDAGTNLNIQVRLANPASGA
jgi:hypothetical protein